MNPPQLLAIGHVTFDITPEGPTKREPGGAVAFASITAKRLGIRPAIVTSCAADYPIDKVVDAPNLCLSVASPDTSIFENCYDRHGDRVQVLHSRANEILAEHIPDAWRNSDLLFVGPLTQELPVDCLKWFQPRVSCVVPQGWLRSWNEPLPCEISVSTSLPSGISRGWDICVISDAEIEPRTLNDWRGIANHLVVTKGRDGADLYSEGRSNPTHVPTFAADVVGAGNDSTGAGDVFAAAMLIRYAGTSDAYSAAEYASLCAALSTRGPSWTAVEIPPDAITALLTD